MRSTRAFRHAVLGGLLAAMLSVPARAAPPPPSAPAQEVGVGPVTKLPLPRYVSLKTDRVNLREGPSKDHRTLWVFQRAGLPVEIVSEYETWRRIRDADGTEGWVLHSLLSSRRTGLVTPPKADKSEPVPLYERADERGDLVARLGAGVIANVKSCVAGWCRVAVVLPAHGGDVDGYLRQDRLWGVYPNEKVD